MLEEAVAKPSLNLDKFRLRRFVERLIDMGEVEIHDEPVPLAELSRIIEASPKAVLFRKAGPEQVEVVAGVTGSRRRVAAGFGVEPKDFIDDYWRRIGNPQPVVRLAAGEAPVQQVVLKGAEVDLTRLPFHPQHELDGGVYLTSGIDYTLDPDSGATNVGCRRLSLRNRTECGINVTAPSDLKRIYQRIVARGERLPISFAVGSHPLDFMAAANRIPAKDEIELVATLRGEPLPLVKCLTNDIWVPADVEMILEGYLDERGYCEPEGPYGEYMGYYGPMHLDPVFHCTAITMRCDVLFQQFLHGSGRILDRCDSPNMGAMRNEAVAMRVLKSVVKEPVAVHSLTTSGGGGGYTLRVAIRQQAPGEARKAIHALFGQIMNVKHIYVVDHDVDVFNDRQMDWAMASRFMADQDLVLIEGIPGMPMDPSLDGRRIGAKAGFDCTVRFGRPQTVEMRVPTAPVFGAAAKYRSVREAVESGPLYFTEIMRGVGSTDGREVTLELDALRQEGLLCRNADGQYFLGASKKGVTTVARRAIETDH
jgi:UbiD family decarboxylase